MKDLVLALVLTFCGCATLTTIGIDPGEQFTLGGRQADAFRAALKNRGAGSVRIAEITAAGDTVLVAALASGATTTASFSAGSAALLINHGPQEASIRGRLQADSTPACATPPWTTRQLAPVVAVPRSTFPPP